MGGLTSDQEHELQALKKMFETEGWAIFKRDQQKLLDHFKTAGWDSIKDMTGLWFAKGMMASLHAIINHERSIEAQETAWRDYVESGGETEG